MLWTTMDSPVGELRVVSSGGALTALDFLGELPAGSGESRSVERAAARTEHRPAGQRSDADPLLREAVRQLTAYFTGTLEVFDLPVAPPGTPFQLGVWSRLREIPYGETVTYGDIARRLGMTGHAARAVGLANGRNPLPVIVPCHRVVGSGGRLTGYGGGLARKQRLLDLEQGALF